MLAMRLRVLWKLEAALMASIIVCLPLVSPVEASVRKSEESTEEIKVEKQVLFYVRNSRGKTRIVGKDRPTIFIKAVKKVRADDYETAKELLADLKYDVKREADKISLLTRYPHKKIRSTGFWGFISRVKNRTEMNYYIEVPRGMEITVNSASGDIEVMRIEKDVKASASSGDVVLRNIGGDVALEISSGDAKVARIGGDLDVSTASGDVEISDVKGDLDVAGSSSDVSAASIGGGARLSLMSGDIELRGCKGNVVAKTASGDIELSDVGGSITATAASGDVDVTILPVKKAEYIITTASGDVEVYYYTVPDYGFFLDVATSSGTISGEMTIKIDKVSRKHLKGTVGSGKALLKIVTASGDIEIGEARGGGH